MDDGAKQRLIEDRPVSSTCRSMAAFHCPGYFTAHAMASVPASLAKWTQSSDASTDFPSNGTSPPPVQLSTCCAVPREP